MGPFPVHDDEHRVLKDITQWKEVIKVPSVDFSDEIWAPAIEHANGVDRDDKYVAVFFASDTFEMTHNLMGMEDAMMGMYEEPECMHELIECLTDYEIRYAEQIIEKMKPNAVFHHDDWGGQISTFMSPDMFGEFYLEPYKRAYKFWNDNGIELIVHHSDSYAATLVPHMIDMGIDVWQGVMTTNNTPELIKQYGSQISFMGQLDRGPLDAVDCSKEAIDEAVEKAYTTCGKNYFIPCLTQGLNFSSFPGVYDYTTEAINRMSKKMF